MSSSSSSVTWAANVVTPDQKMEQLLKWSLDIVQSKSKSVAHAPDKQKQKSGGRTTTAASIREGVKRSLTLLSSSSSSMNGTEERPNKRHKVKIDTTTAAPVDPRQVLHVDVDQADVRREARHVFQHDQLSAFREAAMSLGFAAIGAPHEMAEQMREAADDIQQQQFLPQWCDETGDVTPIVHNEVTKLPVETHIGHTSFACKFRGHPFVHKIASLLLNEDKSDGGIRIVTNSINMGATTQCPNWQTGVSPNGKNKWNAVLIMYNTFPTTRETGGLAVMMGSSEEHAGVLKRAAATSAIVAADTSPEFKLSQTVASETIKRNQPGDSIRLYYNNTTGKFSEPLCTSKRRVALVSHLNPGVIVVCRTDSLYTMVGPSSMSTAASAEQQPHQLAAYGIFTTEERGRVDDDRRIHDLKNGITFRRSLPRLTVPAVAQSTTKQFELPASAITDTSLSVIADRSKWASIVA